MSDILNNEFTYATQYYRPPTPLPDEWENDIDRMHSLTGVDTFQLRVQWRWHEPREGEYVFDDLDELFELAARYGRKVLFKFLLENAPDYIYHRYGGTRRDMNGTAMRPLAHGAYYCGGWLPCFDNPDVLRKAGEFVRVMVERYKDRPELLLWNVWNEPIARPIGECGCTHSVAAYRDWLRRSYGDIGSLNNFLGKRWESFETVEPPASPTDYAELFMWRQWALEAVTERVRFVYDIVKGLDSTRPVITHVGGCSILQDVAGGGSDDVSNAKAVDFYGCSLPTATVLGNPINDCWPALQCDWLRSVSPYYWVYELYPDWGAWHPRVRIGDYKTKVLSSLACGAKGIVYWQYRAERLGMENNLSGLVNIDGSPKAVSNESVKIAGLIREHSDFLMSSRVKTSSIALVYSLKSDLISRVENTGSGGMWDFSLRNPDGSYLYKKALCGAYALFRELGYTVEWLDSRALAKRAQDFELIYLPEYFMPEAGESQALQQFAKNGGKLIAEEGVGLRQANTWVNGSWPAEPFRDMFGVKIDDRALGSFKPERLMLNNTEIIPGTDNFISSLIPEKGEVIGTWSDSSPAVVKNNNCIL
ncbi:MAG: beta-galactosidase, partial [Victivallales bacterium]|nr:beta-galactosidase [Victivallales bacterium]